MYNMSGDYIKYIVSIEPGSEEFSRDVQYEGRLY
jgi:hypothetical protein